MPWHEQSISIAMIFSALFSTSKHFLAAIEPSELWSSWFALVGIESTEAGCDKNFIF